MVVLTCFALLVSLTITFASATIYRPVVIWHGLGDTYSSSGIQHVKQLIEDSYPGIFVHSVFLDEDPSEDQKQSFFGNMTSHLESVCEQLASITELSNGFDAIGFSQGGLFLRAYAETCNTPPLKILVTFGSPHNGISDLPKCPPRDFLCKQRNALLRSQVWSDYAQSHVVSAQYFRDPNDLENYLDHSSFLADVNNEREEKNPFYKKNMASLEKMVMFLFSEDETVIPKESAWFYEVNMESQLVTPLEKRKLFTEDWIGLKNVHLEYSEINGIHMQISDDDLQRVIDKHLGSEAESHSIVFQD